MKSRLILGLILLSILIFSSFYISDKYSNNTQQTIDNKRDKNLKSNKKSYPRFEIFSENLDTPWSIEFIPGENIRLFVTERAGRVRTIDSSGKVSDPILEVKVSNKFQGEGGLLGITVHPDFFQNKYVYIYYTYDETADGTYNRVSRFEYKDNRLLNEKIILDKVQGARFHNGGRIRFGPDGYLYITTGDAQEPSLAQNLDSLAGKILRVDEDGKSAVRNIQNEERGSSIKTGSIIYSYGHRNPQGIAWDNKGNLWSTEHGQNTTDELNLIAYGRNYGWPAIAGDQKRTGMISPIIHSQADTWAPGGIAYYNNSLFYTGLRGSALYEAKLDETRTKVLELKTHFKNEFGRIRDVIAGPDNLLYITTSNKDGRGFPKPNDDKIIRVNPEKL